MSARKSPLVSLNVANSYRQRVAVSGGRPQAPGSSKIGGELGTPPVVPSNPNSRLGRSSRSSIRQGRVAMDSIIVGIDVAKDRLDVAVRPSGEVFVVERNAAGLQLLAERLKPLAPRLVALEATGGFETVVAAALAAAGLPVVIVNPAQVRAFAKAVGQRAKTDPIDAAVIAHFAKPPSPSRGLCPMKPRGCWRAGKALYVGISSYSPGKTEEAVAILRDLGTPLLIHQPSYSMLNRWIEDGLLDVLGTPAASAASRSPRSRRACSPTATSAVRLDSRVRTGRRPVRGHAHRPGRSTGCGRSTAIAARRGQSLAQLALVWALRDPRGMTSLVIENKVGGAVGEQHRRARQSGTQRGGTTPRSTGTPPKRTSICGLRRARSDRSLTLRQGRSRVGTHR